MTSTVVTAFATILFILMNAPASAQQASQQDFAVCQQGSDIARSIAACTRIANDTTQSAADRALAWRWLGNDHLAGSALDEAIRDFGHAIGLDPGNATIYASRAIASRRKGDLAAAIADYRQAVAVDAARIDGMAAASAELKQIADAVAHAPPPSGQPPSSNAAGDAPDEVIRDLVGVSTELKDIAEAAQPAPARSAAPGCGDGVPAVIVQCGTIICDGQTDAMTKVNLKTLDRGLQALQVLINDIGLKYEAFKQACAALKGPGEGPLMDAFRAATVKLGVAREDFSDVVDAQQDPAAREFVADVAAAVGRRDPQSACVGEIHGKRSEILQAAKDALDAAQVDCPTLRR